MLDSKKGMSAAFLVAIIITLASFILIAPLVAKFVGDDDKKAESLCYDSLLLAARTKMDFKVGEFSSPILCKTLDKKISADSKDEVMKYFAERMERTWQVWLEGEKSEVFGPRGLFGDDEQTKCFIFYTLLYKEGPTFTKGELLNYLQENKAKKGNQTFLDYIQRKGYINIFEDSFSAPGAYAVVFASNIEEDFWKETFARQLGFYPTYDRNGLWLIELERLQKKMPCYFEKDIGGQ